MILFLFYKSIFFQILNNIMLFKNDKSCSITYMEQNGSIRQIVYQSVHWEMGAYYYTIVVEKKKSIITSIFYSYSYFLLCVCF